MIATVFSDGAKSLAVSCGTELGSGVGHHIACQQGAGVSIASIVRSAEGGHTEEALRAAVSCGVGGERNTPNARGMSGNNLALLFSAWQPAIRRHPLFVSLCVQLGLLAYWNETSTWPDYANDGALPFDFQERAQAITSNKPLESNSIFRGQ